jgi:hypothetical protein
MPDQIVILDSTFFRSNRLTIDGIDMLSFSEATHQQDGHLYFMLILLKVN